MSMNVPPVPYEPGFERETGIEGNTDELSFLLWIVNAF